jgi:hypothetical protein
MNDNGIAWMIAGGVRAESADDLRQRSHRVAIAQNRHETHDILLSVRRRIGAIRIAAMLEGRSLPQADSTPMAADCCPA